jgi:hypothetical protein
MLSYIFVDGVQLEIGRYELVLFGHFEIVGQSGVSPFLNITQDNIRKLADTLYLPPKLLLGVLQLYTWYRTTVRPDSIRFRIVWPKPRY